MATPSLNLCNRAENGKTRCAQTVPVIFSARLHKFKAPSRAGTAKPAGHRPWRCVLVSCSCRGTQPRNRSELQSWSAEPQNWRSKTSNSLFKTLTLKFPNLEVEVRNPKVGVQNLKAGVPEPQTRSSEPQSPSSEPRSWSSRTSESKFRTSMPLQSVARDAIRSNANASAATVWPYPALDGALNFCCREEKECRPV